MRISKREKAPAARDVTNKAKKTKKTKGKRGAADQNGVSDGGLMVIDLDRRVRHRAPAEVTQALRYALARLQTSDKGDVVPRIAVTSALSGEGVTFIASTFAALVANDLRRKVCLVDLNWWSSDTKIHDPLDNAPPGVAQVIEGRLALDEVLIPTQGWNLSLLPAGPASPAERPVFAKSPALAKMLDELQLRFDHVVLDVPPVLGNGEALTLASLADAFILVVRQGVTAEVQVQSTLEELGHLDPLGVVLNRASSSVPERLVHLLAQ